MSEAVPLLLELAALPTPSGEERAAADVVLRYLSDLGLDADEDGFGNIYTRIEGSAEGTPLFFCAHLDTVPPSGELRPVVEDGIVRNAGGTILGADNKAAVAQMLEGVRRVLVENVAHAGIELVFTREEEIGLLGAAAFDHTRLQAQLGFVYDQEGPIGEIILGAPFAQGLELTFHGRAAHAGMAPEEGRSAIQAAAKAIADLRLGRVDEETTANVGVIRGGAAGNIVPDTCSFLAEARSQNERKLGDLVQEMLDVCAFAASEAECELQSELRKTYSGYRFAKRDDVVLLADEGLRRCGFDVRYGLSGGAADANVFNERGLRCVNLTHGVHDFHSPDERVAVADLEAMVDVTVALVEAARA
ncbi:MAG TPA: M20/M25/M40 family metallo-hydrolase [Gaiellaceae bacterium]|nr:M20/M25/M40 family metallo-hydrolase [Gaiellaceae bacterium]